MPAFSSSPQCMPRSIGRPRSVMMAAIFSPILPAWLMPVRSPFTSAMNTGTPILLKFSAIACSVIVLPVPVAPVISPWRLASAGSTKAWFVPCWAIRRGSAMSLLRGDK